MFSKRHVAMVRHKFVICTFRLDWDVKGREAMFIDGSNGMIKQGRELTCLTSSKSAAGKNVLGLIPPFWCHPLPKLCLIPTHWNLFLQCLLPLAMGGCAPHPADVLGVRPSVSGSQTSLGQDILVGRLLFTRLSVLVSVVVWFVCSYVFQEYLINVWLFER